MAGAKSLIVDDNPGRDIISQPDHIPRCGRPSNVTCCIDERSHVTSLMVRFLLNLELGTRSDLM